MGVKSTTRLTRANAIDLFVEFSMRDQKLIRALRAKAELFSNAELEEELERMNDVYFNEEYGSGGGYDNYAISEHFS